MTLKLYGDKLLHHQDRVDAWRRGDLVAPIFIEFGPVMGCNHRCIHCYVQDVMKEGYIKMPDDVLLRFMREIGEYGVRAITYGGTGEPMLHKMTPQAIAVAKKHGTDVGMFTNGVPINDNNVGYLVDNLTYCRLTINGCSEKSYTKIHECPLSHWTKLKENMKSLVDYKQKMKSKCTLGVYTIIFPDNIYELEDWVKEVREIGFDYIIIKPPGKGVGNVQFVSPIQLQECGDSFMRIKEMNAPDFHVQIRWDLFENGGIVRNYEKCFGLPFMCAVDADGSVYSCNWFWGNERFLYGNLNKNTFPEIWQSQQKKEIVDRMASGLDSKCGACRQNSINNYLWELQNPPDHVNFL